MSTKNELAIRQLQTDLRNAGYYTGNIDGLWGPASETAYNEFKANCDHSKGVELPPVKPSDEITEIRWGAKVSTTFKERVLWIADDLNIGPDVVEGASMLMDCMAFETGETFNPAIKNAAGSSGTGLIQFMSFTAKSLGTTVEDLAKMTAEDQLNYVYKYFAPHKNKLKNIGDIYMAILWPRGIGKPDSYVLWDSKTAPTAYRQNSGLDSNRDGVVVRSEATTKIAAKSKRGAQFMG